MRLFWAIHPFLYKLILRKPVSKSLKIISLNLGFTDIVMSGGSLRIFKEIFIAVDYCKELQPIVTCLNTTFNELQYRVQEGLSIQAAGTQVKYRQYGAADCYQFLQSFQSGLWLFRTEKYPKLEIVSVLQNSQLNIFWGVLSPTGSETIGFSLPPLLLPTIYLDERTRIVMRTAAPCCFQF